MTGPKTNPFVSFLRHYGPVAVSDAMYDELIQTELETYQVDPPIEIEPMRFEALRKNFEAPQPTNMILTGTAGDGKTFHCRRVWEYFGGSKTEWARGQKIARLPLRHGHTLVLVKDLSELTGEEKQDLMPHLSRAVQGQDDRMVYLVAANDGQLLATWRDWAEAAGGDDFAAFKRLEALLVDEEVSDDVLHLNLFNLSRQNAAHHLDQLLEQVVEHPQWSPCASCPLMEDDGSTRCPIQINRARLRGDTPFRARLRDLLNLAAANRLHLPIRHLLLLTVNILLGDAKSREKLLTCRIAKNRADNLEYAPTNPYANVFGGNLSNSHRRQYQAFTVLDSFGIGQETNNTFDNLLIYGRHSDPERYARLVDSDPHYGGNAYRSQLRDYLEGDREDMRGFLQSLDRQRQRLFFSLPENETLNPWDLTVYRYGGRFLEFCADLHAERDVTDTRDPLMKGLNRTFCGMMIEDTANLYVASSGGDGRGKIASVLHHEIRTKKRRREIYATFRIKEGASLPELAVVDPSARDADKQVVAALDLHLTHFEYLMRVSRGSLPASFSRQCFEDFLDFKLRLVECLDEINGPTDDGPDVEFHSIKVDAHGYPKIDEFPIRTGE